MDLQVVVDAAHVETDGVDADVDLVVGSLMAFQNCDKAKGY